MILLVFYWGRVENFWKYLCAMSSFVSCISTVQARKTHKKYDINNRQTFHISFTHLPVHGLYYFYLPPVKHKFLLKQFLQTTYKVKYLMTDCVTWFPGPWQDAKKDFKKYLCKFEKKDLHTCSNFFIYSNLIMKLQQPKKVWMFREQEFWPDVTNAIGHWTVRIHNRYRF